jgi:hypothetical protein
MFFKEKKQLKKQTIHYSNHMYMRKKGIDMINF